MGQPLDILAKSFVRTQQSTTQFASLLHCQWHNEPPPTNPPVPKIAIPGVRDDDEDTLATGDDSASSAHTRTQLDVLLNNGTYSANPATHCTHFPHSVPGTVAADEDGKLCIPNPHAGRLEHPEHRQGAGVQRKYKRHLQHLKDQWSNDPNTSLLQCFVELSNDAPGMTVYAAPNVVSTLGAFPSSHKSHIGLPQVHNNST